jgi:hypothetical protein
MHLRRTSARTSRAFIAVLAVAALGLVGCEKPQPGATAWSGTSSAYVTPVCWAWEGSIDPSTCAQLQDADLPVIEVLDGRIMGISVNPSLTEHGWVPFIDGQALTQQAVRSSYWRVPFPGTLRSQDATLQVMALDGRGGAFGLWAWRLVPAG